MVGTILQQLVLFKREGYRAGFIYIFISFNSNLILFSLCLFSILQLRAKRKVTEAPQDEEEDLT